MRYARHRFALHHKELAQSLTPRMWERRTMHACFKFSSFKLM
jgi:hypothetical protein